MSNVFRGIDHIGLTVPDIEVAHRFLVDGMGAELLYELLSRDDPPIEGPDVEQLVAIPPNTKIDVVRMYSLGDGPAIELFHYRLHDEGEQRPALRACDIGFQHLALYVDDIEGAIGRLQSAGGTLMAEPWDMIGLESGPGNRFCFVLAPFGAMIELVTYPAEQRYTKELGLTRWRPAR